LGREWYQGRKEREKGKTNRRTACSEKEENGSEVIAMALVGALLLSSIVMQSTDFARPEALVDTTWLAAHLSDPGIRIVDMRRNGAADYGAGHIPGAVNVLNDAIRDPKNPPTFLPSREAFEALMAGLGISNATRVIVYDDRGGLYAARLWWILNYFGHSNVALLDGHWIKWSSERRPTSTTTPSVPRTRFTANPQPRWLATADDVRAAIDKSGIRIVDARTTAEIEGRDLRGIRRGGAIPSSVSVYWEDTLDPSSKALKAASELSKLFADAGVRRSDDVIVYCQVGMRASHDLFVLYLLGYDKLRNYYGAWEEWGNRDDLPIKK
jgi:thiosulfate/3-mercaptopyruvate sulfurtransferase